MFFTVNIDLQKRIWDTFFRNKGGRFTFEESVVANVNGPIYLFKGNYPFSGSELFIEQGFVVRPLKHDVIKPIKHSIDFEQCDLFDLKIYKKDFFDRIFHLSCISSGNKNFDKLFCVKGTNKVLIRSLLNDKYLLHELSKNKNMFVNFKSDNRKSVGYMRNFVYVDTLDKLVKMSSMFEMLVTRLILSPDQTV
jgi:hypothetical protein